MKLKPFVRDYRKLRLNNLTAPEFKHLLYLLYWPAYLVAFALIERLAPAASYTPVWCPLDDLIPFCEWFLFPYVAWIASLVVMSLYTLAYDIEAFKRFMRYLILTTAITVAIYIIWPNEQQLRPDLATLGRENLLTKLVGFIYFVDTSTNVCPSLHCIGAFAILFTGLSMKKFRTPGGYAFFWFFALIVCASTVFMKQHSIVDFFAAIPLILLGYFAVFFRRTPT